MNEHDLIKAFHNSPATLNARDYLRAMQLISLEASKLLGSIFNKEAILNDRGQHSAKNDPDDFFSDTNLVQTTVNDLLQEYHHVLQTEKTKPPVAGFIPSMELGAMVVKAPGGEMIITVNLGFFLLMNSINVILAPLLSSILPPRDDRPKRKVNAEQIYVDIANTVLFFVSEGSIGGAKGVKAPSGQLLVTEDELSVAKAMNEAMMTFIVGHELGHVALINGTDAQLAAAIRSFILHNDLMVRPKAKRAFFDGATFLDFLRAAQKKSKETEFLEFGKDRFKSKVAFFKTSRDLEFLSDIIASEMIWTINRHLFKGTVDTELKRHFSVAAPDFVFSLLSLLETVSSCLDQRVQSTAEPDPTHPSPADRKESWRTAPASAVGGWESYWGYLHEFSKNECNLYSDILTEVEQLIKEFTYSTATCPQCSLKCTQIDFSPETIESWIALGPAFPGLQFNCEDCQFPLVAISYCLGCQLLTACQWLPEEVNEVPYCSKCKQKTKAEIIKPMQGLINLLSGRRIRDASIQ